MPATTIDSNAVTTQSNPRPRLRPRRTINRLALALLGLLLGLLGQYFFRPDSLWDGLLFYGLGAILFLRAVSGALTPINQPAASLPANLPIFQTGWRRTAGLWLILLAIGLAGLGYTFFDQAEMLIQAWWLYASSLGLFITGGVLLTPGHPLKSELRFLFPSRRIIYAGALVVALALFMRLYQFGDQPFGIWFDEAEAGLQARQMLAVDSYRPVFYPPINVSGQFLALYAVALAWLGNDIYAIRLVSVLFGLGGVAAAYLFGRELRSPAFGLTLAFLMAVARWPVNFSRIAMTGIDTPFFEFLTLYFFTRFLRRGHVRDAMWAGLSLGLGLTLYTAFRLFVLAMLLFVVYGLIRWWSTATAALRNGGWLRYLSATAMLLVSGWLALMPLIQFALADPEAFLYRTRQISILTKRDQPDLGRALLESAGKHLLMFNVAGDKNGRHNLPGEPMLSPLMAVLFIFGLGLALLKNGQPANSFFLILFPVALLGGIFSVDFEAPQSLRSIAVLPAVIYFCGLSAAALGLEAKQSLRPLPRAWLLVPAAAAAAYIFLNNAHTYFVRQANDFASWNAFSAPETITGRRMAELGPEYVYQLSPFLTNHPSTRFLAPEITRQEWLNLPDALPVRDPSGQPVALFIHPDDSWVYDQARRLYPNATFEVLRGPSDTGVDEGPPSVYFVGLQPSDLMAVRGLELRYWPAAGDVPASQQLLGPLSASRALNINTTWPDDSPAPGNFVAEWNGILYAPRYGQYGFRLITPSNGLLEIDGRVILEGQSQQPVTLRLAQGNHTLRVRAEAGAGQVALYWQPPGQAEALIPTWALYSPPITNHGLLGTFYPNDNWSGEPAFQRIDPFLDTYFHLVPLQRPYSVTWEGALVAPQTGVYQLGLRAVQEAELLLDGQPVLQTIGPNQPSETSVSLEAGLHDLLIRYRDTVDRSRIHLTWRPPNGPPEAIPSDYLWPPMGRYPVAPAAPQPAVEAQPLTLRHLATLGLAPGSEPGQFLEPRDVTVLSNGNIVVADTGNRRVQIFDPQYNHLATLTGDEFPFEEPLAVDVLRRNSDDELLVLESTLQYVYRYDAAGNFIDRFAGPETRLFHPRGLTVFDDNTIGIADTGMARLTIFNADGQQIGQLGALGQSPGQLNEPTDVIRDNQGTFFIAEAENDRIQRLDGGGNPLTQWNIPAAYAFNGPHLALAPDGTVFVTSSQDQTLLRFTPDGALLDQWRTIGPVTLVAPVGVYVDPVTNRLYVTDVLTHQVHVFEIEPLQ